MDTKTTTAGRYLRLHAFVFSVACLWTMLTLDVVYGFLLLHGYYAERRAARRERLAARRLSRQTAAAIPVASVSMQDDSASSMERAA